MAYFPFMIDIEDKTCLIVGGGKIALHKAKLLLEFGAKLRIVAPEVCSGLEHISRVNIMSAHDSNSLRKHMRMEAALWSRSCDIVKKEFTPDDLNNVDFVVAATDNADLDLYISELCRDRGILVNVVDKKEECSFIFPAIIKQGDMVVSVSTGGNSPAGAGYIKRRINENLPEYYGDMVSRLGEYRDYILENVPSAENRKLLFNRLLEYGDSHGGEIPEEIVEEFMSGLR